MNLRLRPETGDVARVHILAAAMGYLVVSAAMRISITHWPEAGWRQPLGALRLCFMDLLLIGAITILALALVHAARRKPPMILAVQSVFVTVTLLLSALACINVRAFELLGRPLTYQWVSYAGDFKSRTARDAVSAAADGSFWRTTAAFFLAYLVTYAVSTLALRRIARGRHSRFLLPIVATGAAAVLILSVHPWQVQGEKRKLLANPLLELISTATAHGTEDLLSQRDGIAPKPLPPQLNAIQDLPTDLRSTNIRNVIIVALESVGSKYVLDRRDGSAADWTPNLSRYEPWTINFTNAYAHAGKTTKTFFSLLTGRPPVFSYLSDTEMFRTTPLVSLPSVLNAQGLRTAIFYPDLEYAKTDQFLKGRGFGVMKDTDNLKCKGSGRDDCSVTALIRWIDARPSPFFAVLWTNDTHYAYYPAKPPRAGQFSPDPDQNRFLAALRGSDAAVGRLLDWLRTRELLGSTLVVVLGDHGDAFGEHGTRSHSGTMFEEELRIPMLLINSSIKGRRSGTLVATSDVPQTILHALKLPAQRSWEGRSFFEPRRSQRVFLFAPQSPAVGFKEGDKKYIYDIGSGEVSLYDLATDPGEKTNIADADTANYARRVSVGWLQAQEARLPERAH